MVTSKLRHQDISSVDLDFWISIVSQLLSSSHNFLHDNTDRIRFPERASVGRVIKDKLFN